MSGAAMVPNCRSYMGSGRIEGILWTPLRKPSRFLTLPGRDPMRCTLLAPEEEGFCVILGGGNYAGTKGLSTEK